MTRRRTRRVGDARAWSWSRAAEITTRWRASSIFACFCATVGTRRSSNACSAQDWCISARPWRGSIFRALESTARVARALRARPFHAAVSVLDARARVFGALASSASSSTRATRINRRRRNVGSRRCVTSMRRVRARRARSPVRRRAVRASVLLLLSSRAPRRTTEQVSVRQVF